MLQQAQVGFRNPKTPCRLHSSTCLGPRQLLDLCVHVAQLLRGVRSVSSFFRQQTRDVLALTSSHNHAQAQTQRDPNAFGGDSSGLLPD